MEKKTINILAILTIVIAGLGSAYFASQNGGYFSADLTGAGFTSSSTPPSGACCNASGACAMSTDTACTSNGHSFDGSASCSPNPCSSSSSSPETGCRDTDSETDGPQCGGECDDFQKECKTTTSGLSCGCSNKGVSCWFCGDGGLCYDMWIEAPSCPSGSTSGGAACISKCKQKTCEDKDPGSGVLCGGSCPSGTECGGDAAAGTCLCLPKSSSSSSSTPIYGCGWKPGPTCSGECPEGAICTTDEQKNPTCGCFYVSSSSSAGAKEGDGMTGDDGMMEGMMP